MATLDWDGLVFYDQQIKKHIENKLVDAGISKDELDKILDKYASKTYVSDEIAKIDLTGYAKTSDIDTKLTNYVKKTDAFSGSYNDLTNKPTIPNVSNLAAKADLTAHTSDNSIHITSAERTKWNSKLDNSDLTNYATKTYVANEVAKVSTSGTVDLTGYAKTADVDTKLANYVKKTDAFSGSYNDLTDKPNIPNVTGKADKTYVDTELAKKANKSELFSGSYNDLTDKPIIPDISNLATKTELNNHVGSTKHITDDERTKWNGYNDTINTMKTNFEDGVNTIYNAVVAKGITPLDKSPSSIVNAIESLIFMPSEPLLTYTFETGSPIIPLLNDDSSYIHFCKDTDNYNGTTTRKLYVAKEVNKISFKQEIGTSSLITLDNTANIKLTSTNSMFYNCVKLRYVNLKNLDTSQVTSMRSMFNGCNNLQSLDLSNLNTSQVDDMRYMFDSCKSLTSLDLHNFNTSKVTTMMNMFSNCSKVTSLDVSNLDTSQVTIMSDMFNGCNNLQSLDISNFNTSNVKNMSGIFRGCKSLTSLDLSNFDTSSVFYMNDMFNGCNSLASLDIRNFSSAASFTDCDYMFNNVRSTCTVYVDKTKFTKTEADCNFTGTFTDVSIQG